MNILNNLGQVGFGNLTDYQAGIIKDITQTIEYYALGDTRKALPIRYLKQQSSDNTDDETSVRQKIYNTTFYAYHLTPVLENQMISPTVQDDETKQGITSSAMGEMVIMSISQPLPGDLFNWYIGNHQGLKNSEVEMFKITDVNFLRTSAELNLYRITFETALVEESKLFIEKSFFYYNEFRKFYSVKYVNFAKEITSKRHITLLKKFYRPEWSIVYDYALTPEVNLKLNKVLLFIKQNEPSNSSGIPLILLNGFNPLKIKEPYLPEPDGINFVREDVWYTNPLYVEDPTKEWNWTNDKIPNELAITVWELMALYKPFIFYKDMDRSQEDDTNLNVYNDVDVNKFATKLKIEDNERLLKLGNVFAKYSLTDEENL